MLKKFILLFLFTSLTSIYIYGQKLSRPFIRNYTPKDYKASNSNWAVTLDDFSIIFIANLEGILTFNSNEWNYLPSNSATLRIYKDPNSNRIYYGTNSDFGYIDVGVSGTIKRTSLSQKFISNRPTGLIWDIISCSGNIYFYSKNVIFEWNGTDIQLINKKDSKFKTRLQCLEENLTLMIENHGLAIYKNDSIQWFFKDESVAEELISLQELAKGEYYIILRNGSKYLLQNNRLQLINELYLNIKQTEIFDYKPLKDTHKAVIGNLTNGILIVDDSLKVLESINKNDGLSSNSIKNILIDNGNNIWTANQEGISFIEYSSPLHQVLNKNQIDGVLTNFLKTNGDLFVGTTEKAFIIHNESVRPIEQLSQRIWSIDLLTPNKVLISSQKNNFLRQNEKIVKLREENTIHHTLKKGRNFIFLHSFGVSFTNSNFQKTSGIETPQETWADARFDRDSSIWGSAKFKGLYHIKDIDSATPSFELYTEKNGLPDVKEIHITDYNDQLLFTTSKGLYQFKAENPDSLKFVPFKGKLNPKGYIKQAVKDQQGNYYFSIQKGRVDHLEKFEPQTDGSFKRIYKPFRRLPDMEINVIYPDKDSIVWIAGDEGLFKYDGKIKKDYTLPFNTLVSHVYSNDSLIFGGFYARYTPENEVPILTIDQPEDAQPTLSFAHNNLTFDYAATFYEMPEKTVFSYYLENNDNNWSKWTTETKKEYTNLPAGRYTFKVKARNIYDTEGRVASYSFTILPPWYQTKWAYVGYGFIGLLFVWFVSLAYTYRVRMHRRKLKLIVADRTFEVISQKKEIESQNKLLQEQYDEISQQRDLIQKNHEELKASQEEVLSINEKLKELNANLEKKVDQRTQKIKATLEKLKKTNKELDTFVYRASHDLKGPISRIHGLTSLAKLESIDPDSHKYYDMIELAALDMQGLLSKLSNAYEIMNKEVHKEKIDIPYLLSEIREGVKFLDQNTKYSFDIEEKLIVNTDKYLLKIILENLFENALIFRKKLSDQPHEVTIKCYEQDSYFYFQIADNGIGIEEKHFEAIFEMFFRGSDQSRGSGLGLYLVKMALEKLQGAVTLESTLFEYSLFTIKIPLQ